MLQWDGILSIKSFFPPANGTKSTLWPSTVAKLLHCHFPAVCRRVNRNCAESTLPERLTIINVLALECCFRILAKEARNDKAITPCLTIDRPGALATPDPTLLDRCMHGAVTPNGLRSKRAAPTDHRLARRRRITI